MLRATSTAVRYRHICDEEELNGGSLVPDDDDHQVEVVGDAEPRGEPEPDARLLVREAARVAAERQARDRRRRHGEEATTAPDPAARAERRQARDPGAPGARSEPRRSRARGARAQVRNATAAPAARRAGAAARRPAAEARRERAGALGQDRAVPLAEGSDQSSVLRSRSAGEDRRGGDGDRP